MKNKGFTIVELITTFALSAVIIILLINIIVVIKNIYYKTDTKTKLYINQGNLSNVMNKEFNTRILVSCTSCASSGICYSFEFSDSKTIDLVINTNSIKFGDYTYNLPAKTSIAGGPYVTESDPDSYNRRFLVVKIPIVNDLYPNMDFGINLVYPYKSNVSIYSE